MDITMCKGEGCPVKERCKRFNAEPGMMQSYFTETPGEWVPNIQTTQGGSVYQLGKGWKCDMFWGEQQDNIMNTLKNIMK